MAKAWLDASVDLGIRVQHPFTFKTTTGEVATTQGVYLPDFGGPHGILLTCRFDADDVTELAEQTSHAQSWLNPQCYEPYSREKFIHALNDWGWFGDPSSRPSWFTGEPWST